MTLNKWCDHIFTLPNLLAFFCLWVPIYAILGAVGMPLEWLNPAALFAICIGCGATAIIRIAYSPVRLWYPTSWFLLTSTIYYGFGPLVYYFGTPETITAMDSFYPISHHLLWRLNILKGIGVACVISVSLLINKIMPNTSPPPTQSVVSSISHINFRHLKRVTVLFAIVGIPTKIFLVLPYVLNKLDIILPGEFIYLSFLSTLALVPSFILCNRTSDKWSKAFFYVLLIFEIVTAYVTLSKLNVMLVVVLVVMAWVLAGAGFKRIVCAGVMVFLLYAVILVPLISYGRGQYNVFGLQSLSDVVALTKDLATGVVTRPNTGNIQGWWARLSYTDQQGYAMEAYDAGLKGDTFALVLWAWAPRLLFPDKPIMVSGKRFNELIIGSTSSQTVPTMFAEGYWNSGWIGVIFVSAVLGVWYALAEKYIKAHLEAMQLEYLPAMWMCLVPAIFQDTWFVPYTFGVLPIGIALHWLAKLAFSIHPTTFRLLILNSKLK